MVTCRASSADHFPYILQSGTRAVVLGRLRELKSHLHIHKGRDFHVVILLSSPLEPGNDLGGKASS